jgi:hypothetical protein
MAMDTDSPNLGRDALKAIENARNISNDFAKSFQIANNLSNSTKEKMKEIVSVVKEHNDLETQISALIQKRDAFIENEVKLGRKVSKIALDMLDTQIALLKKSKEQEDNLEKQKELYKELKGELAGVLGGSEDIAEIFKTGGILALGAKAAISSFEKMGESFSNIFGTAFDMVKTLGLSVGDAAKLGGELGKANFSMTGLIYGSEATAEAAQALADQYGNAGMATSDMIKGVTQLSALTGDAASAVDLALAYENAGIAASDVKANIQEIAGGVGVNANKVAKEMAENQDLIVNATEQELALNTRLTAELVKQGVTRESIKSSSKSLMDIENNIQQANKFRLMTGKQLDVQALTGAAVQLRTARGTENKLEAEKNLLNVIKEQMGAQENYSQMSYEEQEIVQNMLGMDHERLLTMEKSNQAFDLNTKLLEEGSAFMGAITAGATSAGAGIGAMTLELVKMVAQAMIFNKVMTGSSGFGNMFKGKGGGGGVSDIVPGVGDTSVDGGKVGSIGKSIGSTGRGVGSAMKGIAVGFKSFAAPQVALGVGVVTAGIIGLGFALKLAAPGIIAIGKAIGEVIGSIGDFIVKIATPETANGLLSLAPAFAALGLAFIPLAVGLAAMTPVIPTLVALVALGAGIALIANALNGGEGVSITETSDDRKQSDPLLEEIRGLRADIKNQPINVVLNNKIVGEINRSSRAINSYVNK